MKIGNREIGPDQPPYIVAEIGANHGGDLQQALRLIEAAKKAGADAVKFQAYTPDTITLDSDRPEFTIKDGPWQGWRLYDLYRAAQTPFAWFPQLAQFAKNVDIPWFASAFDPSAVDMLVKLGALAIKIASFELVDTPLIRYAAKTGLPIILSTGMAADHEIRLAMDNVRDPIVLHCISGYPTAVADSNLYRLQSWLNERDLIGISDHTLGSDVPIAATVLGACMIEKHFTLDHSPRTPDSEFSMLPGKFYYMTQAVRDIWQAMQPRSVPIESEEAHRPLRRSLFAVQEIIKDQEFTPWNVRSIRPGGGLEPAAIERVIGQRATQNIARGTPLSWDMIGKWSELETMPIPAGTDGPSPSSAAAGAASQDSGEPDRA